jgi:hypothetical protein
MAGRSVMLVGIVGEAAAGFLPWLRTGERERNGYELIDAARTLDVLDSAVVRIMALAWFVVPLAAALCCLAVLLQAPRVAAALAIATGLLGAGFALRVELTPLPALSGAHLTLAAAVAVVVGGTLELVHDLAEGGRRELAPEPR